MALPVLLEKVQRAWSQAGAARQQAGAARVRSERRRSAHAQIAIARRRGAARRTAASSASAAGHSAHSLRQLLAAPRADRSGEARRSERGETITETLVALLIGGLALLMLAVVIASVTRMSAESQQTMDGYYEDANTIAEVAQVTATGKIALQESGASVSISADEDADEPLDANYYEGTTAGRPVVSYSVAGSSQDEGGGI